MNHEDAEGGFIVRAEEGRHEAGIRAVLLAAFPTAAEAELVEALRRARQLVVSLVAEGDLVVGHVAFSPVTADGITGGVGLAPVAVSPRYRRRGIAASLIRQGLQACAALGYRFAVVLGEPGYYGRFGFAPARRWGLRDSHGGGDAFQVLALPPGSSAEDVLTIPPDGRETLVRYAPAFEALPSA